jgi:hypothetical protein
MSQIHEDSVVAEAEDLMDVDETLLQPKKISKEEFAYNIVTDFSPNGQFWKLAMA